MWHLAIEMRSRFPELPMICDPSHICGCREYLSQVAQKSADLDYDGLIVESHICPDEAWSDASQQVTPDGLADLLRGIVWRQSTTDSPTFEAAQPDRPDRRRDVRAARQTDARGRRDRPGQEGQ